MSVKILVAGIAGASLGTEIIKSLHLSSHDYEIHGCDISPLAYGLYKKELAGRFIPDSQSYITDVITYCLTHDIKYIIPGGEVPLSLLIQSYDLLKSNHIQLVGNSLDVITNFSDKATTFKLLEQSGFPIPFTIELKDTTYIDKIPSFPCIIKPAVGSGGSAAVFLVNSSNETKLYYEHLSKIYPKIIVQEYIPLDEGEYTIGVLSLPDKTHVGTIVMERIFNSKLSIAFKSPTGLISSGYSQGKIDTFPSLATQATTIAKSVNSKGPLNIQARVRNGILIPFEINPRFSASTYLRAMAGFNEIDFYMQFLTTGKTSFSYNIKSGYYLRSFEEQFVPIK